LDGDELGLVVALLTGVESYESAELENIVANAGLAHVTAVSGLQLAIITGILYFLFKRTKISWQTEYILGEIILLMFVILTGFPVSVIRSFIMCSIFRLAPPLRLKNDIFSVLCITMVIMTVGSPFLVLNPSFLLSFSGVFGVGVLAPYFTENSNPILKPIIAMSVVSLTILPASCLFFDSASLTSPIANVLIVPICSLISLIMSVVCFLYIFGLFAYPFVLVAGFLTKIVIYGCEIFAKFPYISLSQEAYPYIFLIILGILSIIRIWTDKRKLLTGSFLTSVMAFFVLLSFNKPAKFPQRVDFGDATVIFCENYADIIDRGGRTDYKSVLKFLEENNIYTVNNLFLLDREQYLFVKYRDISAKITYYKGENFTENINKKAYFTGNSQVLVEYSDYSF
jgi:ComEC/Rec2-related protein